MNHPVRLLRVLAMLSVLGAVAAGQVRAAVAHAGALPPIHHVFLIVLENRSFTAAFGPNSPAPYLARTLPARGALLENYYAIGHWSLANYIAMMSGQAPNPATQRDCLDVNNFRLFKPALDSHGEALGVGCVYPPLVKTLPDQLEKAGLSWKGYMEDLGEDSLRDKYGTCTLQRIGQRDLTGFFTGPDGYTAKHDPFLYFHTILDDQTRCAAHVVNLDKLTQDLRSVATTPSYSFIVPNLCHDGQDEHCGNGTPGGAAGMDGFLKKWVPAITRSPAYRKDGLLIVTFAQSDGLTPDGYDACCGEKSLTSNPLKPGFRGPGGGKVGAVALSPFIRPGTVSSLPYNHYALLRTVEDIYGLGHLGYAGEPDLRSFGSDIFSRR
ncbi:MAG TPA: alkaline phosphatase family protein [Steroidobacteraceae bacterium]|jgi:hypothetical protein